MLQAKRSAERQGVVERKRTILQAGNEIGGMLVEATFVVVLIVLLLVGIVELSLYGLVLNDFAMAIREGARVASFTPDIEGNDERVIDSVTAKLSYPTYLDIEGAAFIVTEPDVIDSITNSFGNECNAVVTVAGEAVFTGILGKYINQITRPVESKSTFRYQLQPLCN